MQIVTFAKYLNNVRFNIITMKKIFRNVRLLALISLAISSATIVSCGNDDSTNSTIETPSQDELAKKAIVGTWTFYGMNGEIAEDDCQTKSTMVFNQDGTGSGEIYILSPLEDGSFECISTGKEDFNYVVENNKIVFINVDPETGEEVRVPSDIIEVSGENLVYLQEYPELNHTIEWHWKKK